MDPPRTDADVDSKRATRGVKKASESGLTPLIDGAARFELVTRDAAGVRKYKTLRNSRFGRRASRNNSESGRMRAGTLTPYIQSRPF